MKTILRGMVCVAALLAGASAMGVELTFWSWRVEDKAFYEKIAEDYKKASGDEVRFTAYKNTEYATVLSAALAGGGGPDIIQARSYGGLANLSDAGYLLPLTTKTVPNLAHFSESLLTSVHGYKPPYNEGVYAVPFAIQSPGILYNRKLLASNGFPNLPKTWEEFKSMSRALKAKGVTPLANGTRAAWTLEHVFGVVGPNFYGGTDFYNGVVAGRKRFTDPEFVAAVQEVASLRDFMPPNALGIGEPESRMLFASGKAAFFIGGSWNIDPILEMNPKLELEMAGAPPVVAGGPSLVPTYVDGGYAINAGTKKREAALKFLNYLASVEYGQRFADELRQASAVPGVRINDPVLAGIVAQSRTHGTPFLMLQGFRYQNPSGSILLADGLQKLLQGNGTAQQLAQDIQTGIASWHKPFQK
nr:extracellular solute-binding protein [uncultured Albidiferax sp.]